MEYAGNGVLYREFRAQEEMENKMKGTLEFITFVSQYDSVLDIGCGLGDYLNHITCRTRVGIDICTKALEIARDRAGDQEGINYIQMDLDKFPKLCKSGYFGGFQCVIGTDILEHFEKDRAIEILECCEEIATKALLWFIPIGVHEQDSDPWDLGNDQYQKHKSVWEPGDMYSRGYEVWHYLDWHALKSEPTPPTDVGAMYCMKLLDDDKWKGSCKYHKQRRFPNATVNELRPKTKPQPSPRLGRRIRIKPSVEPKPEPEVELIPKTQQEIEIEQSEEPMTERQFQRKQRLETQRKILEAKMRQEK
jgi:SAM-dependent methyltransferase